MLQLDYQTIVSSLVQSVNYGGAAKLSLMYLGLVVCMAKILWYRTVNFSVNTGVATAKL